jgi:hypothetical protein
MSSLSEQGAQKRAIWYLLVNEDGTLFEYMKDADMLEIPSILLVAQFRQKLHEIYNGPQLAFPVASFLQVFKDEKHFTDHKKDRAVKPLRTDALMTGLGLTYHTPVWVLVPKPHGNQVRRKDTDTWVDERLSHMTMKLDGWNEVESCLTLDLGERLTKIDPAEWAWKNIKVLLGLSGGGKTRTILEILFRDYGIYFVAQCGDIGSQNNRLVIRSALPVLA